MDILELAREAGLQVLLDARIGSQTYHSICGSLPALQRFADAVEAATRAQSPRPHDAARQHAMSPRYTSAKRLRRRAARCRKAFAPTRIGASAAEKTRQDSASTGLHVSPRDGY